jgi:hypothetical protein
MNFNPFEDAMDRIGIPEGELLGLRPGFELQDQQAAGLIGERTGEDDAPLSIKRFEIGQMG